MLLGFHILKIQTDRYKEYYIYSEPDKSEKANVEYRI